MKAMNVSVGRGAAAGAFVALLLWAASAQARMLTVTPLEAQRVERMSRDEKAQYEQVLAALDKILYERALDELQKTIGMDPDNDHLRFMAVQVATYLADTRWGNESTTYYGIAISNLQALAESPRLNAREQGRAKEAIGKLTDLQRSVSTRDELRRQWGLQIAKAYVSEMKGEDKDKIEAEAKAAEGKGAEGGLREGDQDAVATERWAAGRGPGRAGLRFGHGRHDHPAQARQKGRLRLVGPEISTRPPPRGSPPFSTPRSGPDRMKFIVAIIKPFKITAVQQALNGVGVHGMTVTEVKGYGRQKGHSELYRGTEYKIDFVPKLRLEVALDDGQVEAAIDALLHAARTDTIGDGKIFLLPLEDAIRIRTGEEGSDAL